jgi:hypothetical protein
MKYIKCFFGKKRGKADSGAPTVSIKLPGINMKDVIPSEPDFVWENSSKPEKRATRGHGPR